MSNRRGKSKRKIIQAKDSANMKKFFIYVGIITVLLIIGLYILGQM